MRIIKGAALALFVVAGCGHATTTGSAQNDWTTPTGYANATNPRVINPDLPVQPARNRSVFARREAPTLQPTTSDTAAPVDTTAPADTLPPADSAQPAPLTTEPAPDTAAPDVTTPGPYGPSVVPPIETPERP